MSADSAISTKHVISTSFAFFSALLTNYRTLGATVTAGADILNTVLTESAFRTEITVTAYTIEAGFAVLAKLVICTSLALVAALLTDYRTLGATVTARANQINTILTKSAFRTVVTVATYTVKAGFAIVT